jgi:hypothetical protein
MEYDATVKYCSACEALRGQPGDVDPHDQLRGQNHHLRNDGVAEVYGCRCGARLERFVATKAFGAQSGSWKFQ